MTAFDWFAVAALWIGVGNVIVCRDAGDRRTIRRSIHRFGRRSVIASWIAGTILWPLFFILK